MRARDSGEFGMDREYIKNTGNLLFQGIVPKLIPSKSIYLRHLGPKARSGDTIVRKKGTWQCDIFSKHSYFTKKNK